MIHGCKRFDNKDELLKNEEKQVESAENMIVEEVSSNETSQ